MKYLVYILFSQLKLKYYAGQTHDIEKRLNRHNKGYVPSTKSGLPWDLVFMVKLDTRSEVMKLEKKIKKRGIKRFLDDNHIGV